ncbi:MAG: DUF5681 domain-containing protein [Rhodospirillaceae bacterium]
MSDDPKPPPPDYAVGYGRPPPQTRFQKGQSGNPKGRPKTHGPAEVNLAALRTGPVTVMQDGVARQMPAKEVELRRILKKALKGDLRSIRYLLEQFVRYGVLTPQNAPTWGGVAVMPKSMPFAMGRQMFGWFGPPPWTDREVATGRARYVATRSDDQRKADDAGEYDDL